MVGDGCAGRRPCEATTRISLGVIGFTGGFLGALAGVFRVDLSRADPPAPDDLSRFRAHSRITALARGGNLLGIDTGNGPTILQVGQGAKRLCLREMKRHYGS
jgi:hypothetical protein